MRLKRPSVAGLLEFSSKHRALLFTICTICVCSLLASKATNQLVDAWDLKILDSRFALRGWLPADDDIVIVSIEETSLGSDYLTPEVAQLDPALAKMAQGWPYDRSLYADVINRLADAGARLIIFDILFPAARGAGDFDFADAIAEHQDKLILGYTILKVAEQGTGHHHIFQQGNQVILQYPYDDILPLDDDGLLGLVNVWPNTDNIVRQHRDYTTHLFEKTGQNTGAPHYTLAYAATSKLRETTAPIDDFYFINYRGGARNFEYVQIEQLFLPSTWQNSRLQSGAFFKDKIVFIGPVAEQFKDLRATPFSSDRSLMPGVEIHANALASIRAGDRILQANQTTVLTITLVLALFAQLLAHSLRQPAIRAIITFGVFIIFALVTQWLFTHYNVFVPSLKPVFALFILSTIFILFDFTQEQYERHRVRSYLDRYVTSNVANLILEDRGDFEASLKGKRSEVCIFFSDIRGFTTLSEALEPEELVSLLNEYFDPMVDIVLKSNGTLQKFIGDAIMAVWGDTLPMTDEEKCTKAVIASLEMIEALETLNQSITARGHEPLGIGIGLNFGEAIVGNIGHPQRMEFTVLGDAVNLAARLEGATKAFHQEILVGQGVYTLTKHKIAYRFVGRLQVKGKKQAVAVYSPVSTLEKLDSATKAWVAEYETAIEAYFARNFAAAHDGFQSVNKALGNEDFLCLNYSEKCVQYMDTPPPEDWDGTDKLTSK